MVDKNKQEIAEISSGDSSRVAAKPKGGFIMRKMVFGPIIGLIVILLMAGQCGGPQPPVAAGDFSISVAGITVSKGNSRATTVSINRTNGFADLIGLALSGEPVGVSGNFNPVSADSSSDLNLTVTNATAPGSYTLTVTGTANGKTRTAVFSLVVTAVADTTKPRIVSLSPTNNKQGVVNNTNIIIRFSEAMNKASAQASYQSATIGIKPSEVGFSWNSAGTVLTINPNSNLKYKSVVNNSSSAAIQYTYKITNTATDLAGNSISNPKTVKFRTLRKVTHTFFSVISGNIRADGVMNICFSLSICAGDSASAANAQYKGFVGFNISQMANGVTSILSAKVSLFQRKVFGTPYSTLISGSKRLLIDHVNFGPTLTGSDFNTAILRTEGNLTATASLNYKTSDVTASLKDDYAKRTLRGNRSQYMIRFPKISDFDGAFDSATFYREANPGTSKDPKLVVVYLKP